MRDTPTYATTLHKGVTGNDPLGLGTQSERLYDKVFPGINNVVRYIRVYSVICWAVQQVCECQTGVSLKQARERMELLLLWMNPGRGLAGERRRKHFLAAGNNKAVTLTFSFFGKNSATLFHAAQYKPSLTNGLRFLEPSSRTDFECSNPWGRDLALAYDKAARANHNGYKWLRQLNKLQARGSDLTTLGAALNVDAPSSGEKQAFLKSFFPKKHPLDSDADSNRWKSLRLMLRAVHAVSQSKRDSGGRSEVTLREIRICMACGLAPGGKVTIVDGDTREVQATWAVLQLWHLQRLCLETTSYLVEKWLATHSTDREVLTVAGCAKALANAAKPFLKFTGTVRVAETVAYFKSLQKQHPSLYDAAAQPGADRLPARCDAEVWSLVEGIFDAAKSEGKVEDDEGGKTIARVYFGLVFCAVETDNLLRQRGAASSVIEKIDGTRSLVRLCELGRQWKDKEIPDFLAHVVAKWVIYHHFEVAATRSDRTDDKGRLRYVEGDFGLESTRNAPHVPVVTADRLKQAVLLCEQAGLLAAGRQAETYRLTQAGMSRLT